jgi:hypothetical protein
MNKEQLLQQLQIEQLAKAILKEKTVCQYQAFYFRKELKQALQNSQNGQKYLDKLIQEAEINLNNILNFYPHQNAN